jgi:hypothetical protein
VLDIALLNNEQLKICYHTYKTGKVLNKRFAVMLCYVTVETNLSGYISFN